MLNIVPMTWLERQPGWRAGTTQGQKVPNFCLGVNDVWFRECLQGSTKLANKTDHWDASLRCSAPWGIREHQESQRHCEIMSSDPCQERLLLEAWSLFLDSTSGDDGPLTTLPQMQLPLTVLPGHWTFAWWHGGLGQWPGGVPPSLPRLIHHLHPAL